MAYVDQDLKAKISANLKQVMPSGWKYSLAVRNHSTIVLTIYSAPFDLIGAFKANEWFDPKTATQLDVNRYHYRSQMHDECAADVIEQILAALDTDNYDNSDSMTDYFDVGHYVSLKIGKWNRPFTVTGPLGERK